MKCHHCSHESSLPIPDETVPGGVVDLDKDNVTLIREFMEKNNSRIIIHW